MITSVFFFMIDFRDVKMGSRELPFQIETSTANPIHIPSLLMKLLEQLTAINEVTTETI
jgi:hypothetical protein